jgi:ABC-type transport system substrate-binding protein
MNEFLQQNLKAACGVNVEFDVIEWQVLLTAARATPDSPNLRGAMVLNISSPSSDAGIMARYFAAANFSPKGFNFEQWKDDEFEDALKTISEATDPKVISAAYRKANEQLVDNPPWLYIVHDLNPRAIEGQGFRFAAVVVCRSHAGERAIGRAAAASDSSVGRKDQGCSMIITALFGTLARSRRNDAQPNHYLGRTQERSRRAMR